MVSMLLNCVDAFHTSPFKNICSHRKLPIALSRSRQSRTKLNMVFGGIAEKMTGIVEVLSGQTTISEESIEVTLKEIKTILLDADVNLRVANTVISKVKEQAVGMKLDAGQKPGEQFISLLAKELVDIMGKDQTPLTKRSDSRPNTILMLGMTAAMFDQRVTCEIYITH